MSTKTFGHLSGEIYIEIAGERVSLGYVRVPVTGFTEDYGISISADLADIRETIRAIFESATHEKGES